MRVIIMILIAITIGTGMIGDRIPPLTITYDGGGNLKEYISDVVLMAGTRRTIRLDGMCASACVLFLHSDFNIPICITPRARIGFHYPYVVEEGAKDDKELMRLLVETGNYMITGLPKPVKKFLLTKYLPQPMLGDDTSMLATVGYPILSQAYEDCEE